MVLFENRLRFALYSGIERPLLATRRLVSTMISMFELPELPRCEVGVYVTPYYIKLSNIRAGDRSQPESSMACILIPLCTHYANSLDLGIYKRNAIKVYQ
jgi:hypothetical protein